MHRRYCTLADLKDRLTRLDVIEANEWLDALDEEQAEYDARQAAKNKIRT